MTNAATLLRAASFAAERHRGQSRKDDLSHPYIEHLLEVAFLVADTGRIDDTEILAAAILHDTLEDTDTTASELREQFGVRIAALVSEVTDEDGLSENIRRQRQVEHAPLLSDGAKLIKLADKISNVAFITRSPPDDWSLKHLRDYVAWAAAVVSGMRGVNQELEKHFDESAAKARATFG